MATFDPGTFDPGTFDAEAPPSGVAASAFGWSTEAVGAEDISGAAVSEFGFSTNATGTQDSPGTGHSVFGWSTEAAGELGITGDGASEFGWSTEGDGELAGPVTGTSDVTFGSSLGSGAFDSGTFDSGVFDILGGAVRSWLTALSGAAGAAGAAASSFLSSIRALGPNVFFLIWDDGSYNAWPVITRLLDERLFLAYTKGNGHHSDNSGHWIGHFSDDDGESWSDPFVIYDDPTLWTSVMGVSQTSSGRIWVTGWRDSGAPTTAGQGGYVYSDDNGATWSGWNAITTSSDLNEYITGPVIEADNGDLLIPVEITFAADGGLNNSSRLLRWPSGGGGFTDEIVVHDFSDDGFPHFESKLIKLLNGDLLMIHRRGNSSADIHEIQRSTDHGETWSEPWDGPLGYGAPSCWQLASGVLVFITRRAGDAATIAYVSTDFGVTWPIVIEIDDRPFEMEYGAVVELLSPNSILVVWSLQPTSSIFNADIWSTFVFGLPAEVGSFGSAASEFGWSTSANGAVGDLPVSGTASSSFGWSTEGTGSTETITNQSHVAFGWSTSGTGIIGELIVRAKTRRLRWIMLPKGVWYQPKSNPEGRLNE